MPTIDSALGVVSAVLCCGVIYGILKTKVDRLAEDSSELTKKMDGIESKYVTRQHFETVVNQLQYSMREIERDIKKILVLVSHKQEQSDD